MLLSPCPPSPSRRTHGGLRGKGGKKPVTHQNGEIPREQAPCRLPAPHWLPHLLLVTAPQPIRADKLWGICLELPPFLAQQICRRGEFRRGDLQSETPGEWGGGQAGVLRGPKLGLRPMAPSLQQVSSKSYVEEQQQLKER